MLIVSNRLPVVLSKSANGSWEAHPGSGGLVTALSSVLRRRRGSWVGWPGATLDGGESFQPMLDRLEDEHATSLHPVPLTAEDIRGYYEGFSNEVLWPLFHDLPSKCNFDSSYWKTYCSVNRKFAHAVAGRRREDDLIWVHDYHLMRVARELRRAGVGNRLGFFLHIPFPGPDTFVRLPWRRELLDGLLHFDLLGFQRSRDRDNFVDCVRALAKHTELTRDRSLIQVETVIRCAGGSSKRRSRLGSFPIGIDDRDFRRAAETDEVRRRATRLRMELGGVKIVLGVDRLDYTKGLPEKLRGFREALVQHPDLRRRVSLVQHVVPSRESVPDYQSLKLEVERLVSEINGELGTPGWVPVRYFYQSLGSDELVAFYRAADALLVTSLKDGMNLVAKEYCAANVDERGVLLLSEFTGAASELSDGALLVNPHDCEDVAAQIFRAVTMAEATRRRNMRRLRETIAAHDVFRWVESFVRPLGRLTDSPHPEGDDPYGPYGPYRPSPFPARSLA